MVLPAAHKENKQYYFRLKISSMDYLVRRRLFVFTIWFLISDFISKRRTHFDLRRCSFRTATIVYRHTHTHAKGLVEKGIYVGIEKASCCYTIGSLSLLWCVFCIISNDAATLFPIASKTNDL